jgi:hypothetical protein
MPALLKFAKISLCCEGWRSRHWYLAPFLQTTSPRPYRGKPEQGGEKPNDLGHVGPYIYHNGIRHPGRHAVRSDSCGHLHSIFEDRASSSMPYQMEKASNVLVHGDHVIAAQLLLWLFCRRGRFRNAKTSLSVQKTKRDT